MYINRHAEKAIKELSKMFGAILVAEPRQVGKTPKLYFLDTGLAAYLTRWNTPEVLKSGAMAGAFFESFVIAEIIKSYYNSGVVDSPLYFYRDRDMNEIDLLIEDSGILYPLEMKRHADPKKAMLPHLVLLTKSLIL